MFEAIYTQFLKIGGKWLDNSNLLGWTILSKNVFQFKYLLLWDLEYLFRPKYHYPQKSIVSKDPPNQDSPHPDIDIGNYLIFTVLKISL